MGLGRRAFLKQALIGCSAAASPLFTPVTFAQVPGENRLVVILLRGALDGLAVLPPVGDPDFARLRPDAQAEALTGFYGLHPGLAPLRPLWEAGDLAFVPAVSTPYRDQRSHFDGQDLLEAGQAQDWLGERRAVGWLNRLLSVLPDARADTALAIGRERALILSGPERAASWSPEARLLMTPATEALLAHVYHDDPLFADALEDALGLSAALYGEGLPDGEAAMEAGMMEAVRATRSGGQAVAVAGFAAARQSAEARIASFSLGGWDTHRGQEAALRRPLATLVETILALRDGLGPVWDRTAILMVTEFGRTVRINGTGGTDHGTGGTMILAGGAVNGGRVVGDWPGLGEADLYAGRDLMPVRDLRAHAGHVLAGLFGVPRAEIVATVFPGVDLGPDPGLLA